MEEKRYFLAIDIGASSGRHILAHKEDGRIILEEVHRFESAQRRELDHDSWDIDGLWQGILDGLKECGRQGKTPESVGIDTWGVDFVLLDEKGSAIPPVVAYRDARTDGIPDEAELIMPFRELYSRTGIQKQKFNTLYQLLALKKENPDALQKASSFLMIPDYFNYLLTGVKKQEYTNVTTTGMVNARTRDWDSEIIARYGLPKMLFGKLSFPGDVVGQFKDEIAREVGFSSTVVLPATHDTGSAFISVPARDEDALYISSGTWSLLGVENDYAMTSPESMDLNFTNEGGAYGKYRYLKNIMGLWMIQEIRRELNGKTYVKGKNGPRLASGSRIWSFQDLADEAMKNADFPSVVDVNAPVFLSPDNMACAVKEECERSGQRVPGTIGEVMATVYKSLALSYKDAIAGLERMTGKKCTSINIVGGGSKDECLDRLTHECTDLPVYAGPAEGTALGNAAVQMIKAGEFQSVQEARDAIFKSFGIKEFK